MSNLAKGLVVRIDDRDVSLEVLSSRDRPDLVSTHTRIMEIVLSATFDLTGQHKVEVGNANLPGDPNYFYTDVTVPQSAIIHETNLVARRADGTTVDLAAAWSRSELRRQIQVDVTIPDDPWSRLVDWREPAMVTIRLAPTRPLHRAWPAGRRTPETLVVALLLAFAAGLGASQRGPRRSVYLLSLIHI